MEISRRSRPKGAWETYPPLDPEAELTWKQIYKKVDEILGMDAPRVHKFPWAKGKQTRPPEITILPHGAKQIKYHDPEDD